MTRLIIEISKYVLIALIVLYTLQCYLAFVKKDEDSREFLFLRQNVVMFCIHFVAFMVFYLKMERPMLLYFYGAQVLYLLAALVFFRNLYPRASKLIINNMCMLITIGFIMLTRLSYDQSTKQFTILAVGTVIALIIPVIIRKMRILTKWAWVYAVLGIGLLGVVAVIARSTYGAKLSLSVGGITLQPSEFVKILFVFFAAGMLAKSIEFKNIVITTGLAAFHVLILVISTDLGSALIFFITYLMMLYVATKDIRYLLAGFAAGAVAAVAAYFLFSHVRVRVEIWQDPFKEYEGGGYQVAQALFAIGAGGWFGTGLFQGSPGAIPIVDQDFMFAAIVEELGGIFAICLILICMSCFIMFVNISMKLEENFYRYVAFGLGCLYGVQVFLTVGGAMKMIPMTGVTLPLISTGGSSLLSTLASFSIIQGLYILREDEENRFEEEEYYDNGNGGYPDSRYPY
ncbi:FtsW/RodA/SpoVE family cell cycle protein [Hominisplanchenecus murintestinalis]|uniref:FtsW/RodA/SpoVE family cell cycle protein n=1 Tax=Hominisplanchenecus murintestinalis TaxID=2941517 RepID=UPI002ED0FA00